MRLLPISLWLLVAAHIDAQAQLPTAIRKMSPDGGEKFFPEYYAFADGEEYADILPSAGAVAARRAFDNADAHLLAANGSAQLGFRPPFAPHRVPDEAGDLRNIRAAEAVGRRADGVRGWGLFGRAAEVLAQLEKRDWACPTGTNSCESIGYPDSCCQDSETCVVVTDTGLGNVGCCPSGETCSGTVSNCTNGSTACPSSLGGGCCIAGYVCEGVGCVLSSSSSTSSPTSTSAPPTDSVLTLTTTSTTVLSEPTPSTVVVTTVVTETASSLPLVTSTFTETVSTSTSQSTSTSATTAAQTTTTTDSGAVPPVRPTSSAGTSSSTFCPTGFYPCLASAGSGCCQTGRGCDTTSCPPLSYTTIEETNGITVVVPLPVPSATTTVGADSCAAGWFLCGADAGPVAGCCPSGYSCGTASCSLATLGGTATAAKELPGSGGAGRVARGGNLLAAVLALLALMV